MKLQCLGVTWGHVLFRVPSPIIHHQVHPDHSALVSSVKGDSHWSFGLVVIKHVAFSDSLYNTITANIYVLYVDWTEKKNQKLQEINRWSNLYLILLLYVIEQNKHIL
jgi:hypothetical protein